MAGPWQRAVCRPVRASRAWHRWLVRCRRYTAAALETGGGDLAGVFPGVVAVQLRPGATAQRTGPVQPRAGQHPGAHTADGLPVHSTLDPPAGQLAAPFAATGQGYRSRRVSTGRLVAGMI